MLDKLLVAPRNITVPIMECSRKIRDRAWKNFILWQDLPNEDWLVRKRAGKTQHLAARFSRAQNKELSSQSLKHGHIDVLRQLLNSWRSCKLLSNSYQLHFVKGSTSDRCFSVCSAGSCVHVPAKPKGTECDLLVFFQFLLRRSSILCGMCYSVISSSTLSFE